MAQPAPKRSRSSSTQPKQRPFKKKRYTNTKAIIYRQIQNAQEKKYFDTSLTALALTLAGTGTVYPSMALVSVGNTANTMIGRKITVTSIHVRAYILAPQESGTLAALNAGAEHRLDLFIDKQPLGATATIANIYETSTINSFLDLEHSSRFKLLRTHNKPLNRTPIFNGTAGTFNLGADLQPVDFHVNCNEKIEYETQAGIGRVIGEITTNNIFLAGFSTTNSSSVVGFVRIRYTDS